MKKFLGLFALAPFAALATGESGAATYSGSVAETIVTDASGTITNFLTGAGTTIAVIVVAGLAISVGLALVGIIMRAFRTGKGR